MKLYLPLVLAVFVALSFAQEPEQNKSTGKKEIGLGARLAVGYGMIWGLKDDWSIDEDDENPGGLDLEAGVMGRYVVTPIVHFTPELLFHYGKPKHDNKYGKYEFSFMNVEIPLLVRAYASPKFYGYIGPQLGFNIHNDVSLKAKYADKTGSNPTGYTKFGKKVDQAVFGFGIAAGVGYYLMDKLSLDFRTYMGLTEQYPDTKGSLVDLKGAKLLSFAIGANYWIF